MSVVHMLVMQFKDGTESAAIENAFNRIIALKDSCLHPVTKKPYVLSIRGGINNSPEGAANGMTHGIVMEFENTEDRDYYANKDEAHLECKQFLLSSGNLANLIVLDFTDGVLT